MAMNPEIKARWVAALRSGEYKQGKGQLYVLRNVNKGERLARANDAYALEIQLQGYIGEVAR